jgi:hypothetical protein
MEVCMKHAHSITILISVVGLVCAGLLMGLMISQAEASSNTPISQKGIQANNIYLPCILYCVPLYFDNFSNPSSGWLIYDDSDALFGYNNGEYQILVKSPAWATGTHPDFKASNYSVYADVRNPNSVFGSYGIGFGIAQDWSTLYTFEIYPDGWFGLYRVDSSGFVKLIEAYSPLINQGSASNQIKLERNNASISAYSNGMLLANVTDNTYTGSLYIGLIASSYGDANLDIRYDNFRVDPITCAGTQPSEYSLSNIKPAGSFLSRGIDRLDTNKHQP